MNEKTLSEDTLAAVTGGIDKIEVDIKTLSGDDDPYVIALTDTVNQTLDKYNADKQLDQH